MDELLINLLWPNNRIYVAVSHADDKLRAQTWLCAVGPAIVNPYSARSVRLGPNSQQIMPRHGEKWTN